MKSQYNKVLNILKNEVKIDGCITGSIMLEYNKAWKQDVDVFAYNQASFNKLIFFMYYHPMFVCADQLEKHKLDEYINSGKSSLNKLSLITIKFLFNTCIEVNVIFKEYQNNIFDVISNFDLDIVATGYDIKTGKTLSLRETKGKKGSWNRWNKTFFQPDFWSAKRLLRQFTRVIKYTERGYDLTEVTDKYISIIKEIIKTDNFYKTEKGTRYFEENIEQLKVVLKILQTWKRTQKISKEELEILNTLI